MSGMRLTRTSILISLSLWTLQGAKAIDYGDYGGGMDPYGTLGNEGREQDPGDFDYGSPGRYKEDMMGDIEDQRLGTPNEMSTAKKKFKLFEKRRLNYEKAKAFCKKREGQLAQAVNVDEMQRLQTLIMRGTTLTTNVWIGADKREWKKHSSKMLGIQPKLPPGAMLMGGGSTKMCPGMSISTRSTTPVECFKEFAFICEFPPGKGKAPPKKAKKMKTTTKDEMRRKKRGIDSSVYGQENFSTQPYQPYSFKSIPEILTTRDYQNTSEGTSPSSTSEPIQKGPLCRTSVEVSGQVSDTAKSTMDRSFTEPVFTPSEPPDNALVFDDINPDQQLLNLFDEQLENMSLFADPTKSSSRIKSVVDELERNGSTDGSKNCTNNTSSHEIGGEDQEILSSTYGQQSTEAYKTANLGDIKDLSQHNKTNTSNTHGTKSFVASPSRSEYEDKQSEKPFQMGKMIWTNDSAPTHQMQNDSVQIEFES